MKIAMHDSCAWKFSEPIYQYWINKGHDVRREIGSNPVEFGPWADLIYIDWMDNNFYCYFNGPKGYDNTPEWKPEPYPKKRICVRGIDLDIWMGRHCDPRIWTYLDDMITIHPYMYGKVKLEANPPANKLHLIKPGVQLDKFTYKDRSLTHGSKIAMITGNFWEMKNFIEGVRIFELLCKRYPGNWELHIRGEHNSRQMEQIMKDHILESSRVADKIHIYGRVDSINDWLEDKDYILVPSLKEMFSYGAAEAMSKGIKPILNNWWGASETWDDKFIYKDLDEAVEMFKGEYNSLEYRSIIEDRYDFKDMMHQYDELLGT